MNGAQNVLIVAEFYACICMGLSLIIKLSSSPKDFGPVYTYKISLILGEAISVFMFFKVGLYFLMLAMCYYLSMDLWEFKKIIFKDKQIPPRKSYNIDSWMAKAIKELIYTSVLLFVAVSLGKWLTAVSATDWPAHLMIDKFPYTDALAALLLTFPHAQATNGKTEKLLYVFWGYIATTLACLKVELYIFSILLCVLSILALRNWFVNNFDFGEIYYADRY